MSMRPLVIFGAGGHAKMVIEAAQSNGAFHVVMCLDRYVEGKKTLLGIEVRKETDEELSMLLKTQSMVFIALGDNALRERVAMRLTEMGLELATIVASTAYVSPSAFLGSGTIVMPRAAIGASATLDPGCIVNTCASIDHDCRIGPYAHIAPGSHLAGNVTVGRRAFLGVGTSVIPEVEIGSDSIVGAGSVVIRSVPSGATWGGVPAKPLYRSRAS